MKDALIISALSVIPKAGTSRTLGRINRIRWPKWMHRLVLRAYVSHYKVDLSECVGGIDDYESLGAFFVRALKPGVRPVDPAPEAMVSPVDGKVYAVGTARDGRIPQSEGKTFSSGEMQGETQDTACDYIVIYLSPRDYHRIHVPREGRVVRMRYLPGLFWPVFPAATRKIPELFSRNERLVSVIEAPGFRYALGMIGAFGVGRMRVVYHDVLTNSGVEGVDVAVDVPMERAQEIGRFEMGSTVVLILPPGSARWTVSPGQAVRLGERIAAIDATPRA